MIFETIHVCVNLIIRLITSIFCTDHEKSCVFYNSAYNYQIVLTYYQFFDKDKKAEMQ